jgi:formylglycine-generating enzyme required for sulfatase activity
MTCHTGVMDEGEVTVDDAYWIGQSEVTYELWSTVYSWATTDAGSGLRADGGQLYSFANTGTKGSNSSVCTDQNPVTGISWRDSIIFCNALTEWYNAQNGTDYDCVYCTDRLYTQPLRSVDADTTLELTPVRRITPL